MNERGFSYAESCLALLIFMTVVGLVLSIQQSLQRTLHYEIVQVHATEAAMNGALLTKYYEDTSGQFVIDGITYEWRYELNKICVSYQWLQEVEQRCIAAD